MFRLLHRTLATGLVCFLTCGFPATARQNDGSEPISPVHFAYATSATGSFSVGGKSTQVVRIPLGYGLRPPAEDQWSLKLRLPVSLGFHELEARTDSGSRLTERVETLTFTPGIELQIPVGRRWRLTPYVEAGLGTQLSGDIEALVYRGGFRALWLQRLNRLEIRVGSGVEQEGFRLLGSDRFRDSYGLVELGADLRWPLGLKIRGARANLSAYLIARRFVPEVLLAPLPDQPLVIDGQWELGLTVGTEPRLQVWGVRMPRLGLGYQSGDGLSGFRLSFGFPF